MVDFVEVVVFASHDENRDDVLIGVPLVQLPAQVDRGADLIDEVQRTGKEARLVSGDDRESVLVQQTLHLRARRIGIFEVFVLIQKLVHQQFSVRIVLRLIGHHIGESAWGDGVFEECLQVFRPGGVGHVAFGKLGDFFEGNTENLHGCIWSTVRLG